MSGGELFHYTTAIGLKGILESGNFHATHYRYLNDRSEVTFLSPQVHDFFTQELIELVAGDKARFGWMDEVQRFRLVESEVKGLLEVAFESLEGLSPIFILSLCKHEDTEIAADGLLSQWRSYGSDGGYVLVFDEQAFIEKIDEINNLQKYASLQRSFVNYPKSTEKIDIARLQGVATHYFKLKFDGLLKKGLQGFPTTSAVSFNYSSGELDDRKLIDALVGFFPFYKHYGFHQEKEYRVAAAAFTKNVQSPLGIPPAFQFRQSSHTFVPYVELFDGPQVFPLQRIIVGPGGMQEVRKRSVIELTRSLQMKVEITTSQIPYI